MTNRTDNNLWNKAVSSPSYVVDLSDYATGVYLFQLLTADGTLLESKKILIE